MDLTPFIREVEKQGFAVEGIIVSRCGRTIASHRFVPEAARNVFSVSKSFTSIAAGMVIDEGKLKLESKLVDFFPRRSAPPRLAALNLRHLLTMTRGHNEFTRPQSVDEAISHELVWEPGEFFLYDNACTFLVSAMITKVTGLTLRDFLGERLFRPLGIAPPVWPESDDGYTIGATGLELTTSDLERFGRFLLNRGGWEGRRLVSPEWIDGATRTQVATRNSQNKNDYDLGYGFQFWTCRHGAYRCDGKDGQFVIVIPRLDAVIAVNSNEENMKPILWAVWDFLLPELERASGGGEGARGALAVSV